MACVAYGKEPPPALEPADMYGCTAAVGCGAEKAGCDVCAYAGAYAEGYAWVYAGAYA